MGLWGLIPAPSRHLCRLDTTSLQTGPTQKSTCKLNDEGAHGSCSPLWKGVCIKEEIKVLYFPLLTSTPLGEDGCDG